MAHSTAHWTGNGLKAITLATWLGAAALCLGGVAPAPALAFQACPAIPLATVPPGEPAEPGSKEPPNLGLLKREAVNYKCFGDYDRDVASLLAKAQAYVEAHAGDAPKPALVLDIDETSLSNWPVILNDDFGFIVDGPCDLAVKGACGWIEWQGSALDQPINPTLQLFNAAKAKGVAVFFITGRRDLGTARAATEANLIAAGFVGWAKLIMRPGDSPHLDTVAEFKAPARAEIEQEGYTIIANVGDQWSDLNGGHALMSFKVPNPFYFIK
jgi:HAD superfamily, subfamily IIIB (Acid phosphatase)